MAGELVPIDEKRTCLIPVESEAGQIVRAVMKETNALVEQSQRFVQESGGTVTIWERIRYVRRKAQ